MTKCRICKQHEGSFQTPSTHYIKQCFIITQEPINVCEQCLLNLDDKDYIFDKVCKNIAVKEEVKS
jgi:hypothetical protein